jgi:hypothetical protein
MLKLYIIESNSNGKTIWNGIGQTNPKKPFSNFWIRSSFTDVKRMFLWEAVFYWCYCKLTRELPLA